MRSLSADRRLATPAAAVEARRWAPSADGFVASIRHARFGEVRRSVSADVVLVSHFLFAIFAVLGGFLVLIDRKVMFVHIPTVIWSSVVNLADWTCPLTPLEKNLRERAGQRVYEGSWIQNYLEPLVRPLGMPRRMELVAGVSIIVWNLVVYGVIFFWGSGA